MTPEETLPPQDWADPTGKGLLASMDDYFDPPSTPQPAEPAPPMPQERQQEPAKQPEQKATPEPARGPIEPIISEPFFSDTADEPSLPSPAAVTGFDESAFDKETEALTDGLSTAAATKGGKSAFDKFKELRGQLKEVQQKQAVQVVPEDVQKKLETLELKAKEAEGLRTRLESVTSQSAVLQVENSDEYDAEVVQPAGKLFGRADELSKLYDLEPSILRAIIKENDRKIQNEEISQNLREFSDFDRNEAYRMIQDFGRLLDKRNTMLSDADKRVERQQAARIENEQKLLNEQRTITQTMQRNIWDRYKDKIPGFVEDGEETPTFKKLQGQGLSIDFSRAKASDQAFAAFAGVALPHVVQQLAETKKRLAQYEKTDERSFKKAPTPSESVNTTPIDKEAKTFMDAFMDQDFR